MSISQVTSSQPLAREVSSPERRRPRAPLVILGLSLVACGALGARYVVTRGVQSTDDAQVEGHIINVSSRVSGQVLHVHVQDNQVIARGDVLVELDPTDFIVRLDVARADLAAARATAAGAEQNIALTAKSAPAGLAQAHGGVKAALSAVSSARAAIERAAAQVQAAESRKILAELNLERVGTLLKSNADTQAAFDSQRAEYRGAEAAWLQAKAQLAIAQADFEASGGNADLATGRLRAAETSQEQIELAKAAHSVAEAHVQQMEATVKAAELNLSYTTLRAVRAGIVSRRNAEEGQSVSPERSLLALVPLDDIWVVANFKEDQLADMRVGQLATVTVDTYSGRTMTGHVDSLASGTGARFALIPPDNAGGNFIKVVQRVPVLIRLDGTPGIDLRLGMSAEVVVNTNGG
jgi:membrane fusion protein (multidrug efflux system)